MPATKFISSACLIVPSVVWKTLEVLVIASLEMTFLPRRRPPAAAYFVQIM